MLMDRRIVKFDDHRLTSFRGLCPSCWFKLYRTVTLLDMLKNPSVQALLRNCVLAQFKVSPVPQSLTQSLGIYSHFAKLSEPSSIVEYKHDICPVTKRRLEMLKIIFHDKQKLDSGLSPDGRIINQARLKGEITREHLEQLSPLEQKILKNDSIQIQDGTTFNIDLVFLSRNKDDITRSRDIHVASSMGTWTEGFDSYDTLRESIKTADEKYEQELQAFINDLQKDRS